MITLKAALIAASAVGTVAVGGATWALTGSHGDAGVHTHGAKAPAAQHRVHDTLPSSAPTCVPAKPGLPDAKAPQTGVKKEIDERLGQNRAARDLPKVDVPDAQVPGAEIPDAKVPNVKTPKVEAPDVRGKVPADPPTCVPGTKDLPKAPSVKKPDARVPGKPVLPSTPKLDCSKLTPAIQVGGPVERTVMLTKGLRHVATVPGSADLQKKNICSVTQKWVGANGRWITVETLKAPAGVAQNQLRHTLGLKDGTVTTVHGVTRWVSRDRGAVLLFGPDGRSLLVNGSPALAGGLTDVAAALAETR
ncbi:MAG TPA: hypothetical protein VIL71_12365 [Spirillospora sp.]